MEPEGSLPHSQEPATCPYSEPDQNTFKYPKRFRAGARMTHNLCIWRQGTGRHHDRD